MGHAMIGSNPPLCYQHGGLAAGGRRRRKEKEADDDEAWPAFYRVAFSPQEMADLRQLATEEGLDEEIATTRIILRRLLLYLRDNPDLDAATLAKLAPLAFRGTQTVAQLLRDQRALSGAASDGIAGAIGQALDELATEWGVEL